MKYVLKTTGGNYDLNFGNYFLKKLAANKGVDYTKAANGLFIEFAKLFRVVDGENVYNIDSPLTPFLDELVYVVQAAHQSANAEHGIFDVKPIHEWEYITLDQLGNLSEMFTKYGEIVRLVGECINPEGLGKDEPKQKKSVAGKRKQTLTM